MAIADEGRSGEVRYHGEIDSDPPSVRRMVARLEKRQLADGFVRLVRHPDWRQFTGAQQPGKLEGVPADRLLPNPPDASE